MPTTLPILEINPRHRLIRRMAELTNIEDAASTLMDLARIQDGEPPRDPAAFARQMAASLADTLS